MSFENLNALIGGLENQPSWQTRRQFRQVVEYWPKAVGHLVARQSRPVSIQRQVLYVSVATAAWAQNLMFERQRILGKLNARLTCPLSGLRFSAAQWTVDGTKPTRPAPATSELIKQHPSYVEPSTAVAADPNRPNANGSDPLESSTHLSPVTQAFLSWSDRIRADQKHQVLCPSCQCYCPPGELKRWQTCALCAAKSWKTNSPLG
ncbi:MAG: DciA family protein [Cyanobacteria bacterium P01_D01_bin.14]